jgi:hypothetical protein
VPEVQAELCLQEEGVVAVVDRPVQVEQVVEEVHCPLVERVEAEVEGQMTRRQASKGA